jgi:hypothetical protein
MICRHIAAAISWVLLAVIVFKAEAVFASAAGGVQLDEASPLICPATQPISGEVCSNPTPTDTSCDYGETCCPGDGGKCVAKTVCVCSAPYGDGETLSWTCKDDGRYGILPCPSVCPEVPPTRTETCEINEIFECGYGKELVCNDATGSSFKQHEIACVL